MPPGFLAIASVTRGYDPVLPGFGFSTFFFSFASSPIFGSPLLTFLRLSAVPNFFPVAHCGPVDYTTIGKVSAH